jgi:hypothetical protein
MSEIPKKSQFNNDDFDLGTMCMIRLMGQTGVCVGWLEDNVLQQLLDHCVRVL